MDVTSREEVERKLIDEVSLILNKAPGDIKPDASLPSLGLDSMGFVELLVVVEKVFGVRLIESGLTRDDFETIQALAARISKGVPG